MLIERDISISKDSLRFDQVVLLCCRFHDELVAQNVGPDREILTGSFLF